MKTRVSLKYFVSYCSLLGNLLTGKGILRASSSRPSSSASQNKKGKGLVRAGTGKEWDF